jgi:hypothetical protein
LSFLKKARRRERKPSLLEEEGAEEEEGEVRLSPTVVIKEPEWWRIRREAS